MHIQWIPILLFGMKWLLFKIEESKLHEWWVILKHLVNLHQLLVIQNMWLLLLCVWLLFCVDRYKCNADYSTSRRSQDLLCVAWISFTSLEHWLYLYRCVLKGVDICILSSQCGTNYRDVSSITHYFKCHSFQKVATWLFFLLKTFLLFLSLSLGSL